MAIRHAIWHVSENPQPLAPSNLPSETLLESMIVAAPDSRTLNLPDPGDRIWVKSPNHGFVGVSRVTGSPQPMPSFEVMTDDGPKAATDVLTGGTYHRELSNDPEKCEYFLPVQWLDTVPLDAAIREVGLFGNQNTVCAPRTQRWRHTVERLKKAFPHWDVPIQTTEPHER